MKIAVHNGSRVWGGNEKWLLTTVEGLRARGHEVVACCRPRTPVAQRFADAGVRVSSARPGVGIDLAHAVAFARFLSRERPDALLLTSWSGVFWGAWAGRMAGVRCVAVRQGVVRESLQPRAHLRYAFRRWIDRVIVNSREVGDMVRAWLPAERVRLVLNAVPLGTDERAAASGWLRGQLGIPGGALVITGVGHVEHRKGFDLLLRAFADGTAPDARLVIVGSGGELPRLRELAASLGVADRVSWMGHRDDVPRILAGTSLFVLSSRSEGMANVMLEAMAAGTPVIATAISGVHGALAARDGHPAAGWIIPPDDVPAMAAAIAGLARQLGSGDAEVVRRTDEALRRVRDEFGAERMIAEVESALTP